LPYLGTVKQKGVTSYKEEEGVGMPKKKFTALLNGKKVGASKKSVSQV